MEGYYKYRVTFRRHVVIEGVSSHESVGGYQLSSEDAYDHLVEQVRRARLNGDEIVEVYISTNLITNPFLEDDCLLYEDNYDTPIRLSNLSSRTKNALCRAGITTLEQLACMGLVEVLEIRNIGIHTLREINNEFHLWNGLDIDVIAEQPSLLYS